jgi:hypothetical protein
MLHFMCAFAEPYYDGNSSPPHSPDISGVERQPSLSNVSGFSDFFLSFIDRTSKMKCVFTLSFLSYDCDGG